jgi:hypothetical protein
VQFTDESLQPTGELARRLRALREESWPDLTVTQAHVGQVLGEALGDGKPLSVAAISSWESSKTQRMPQAAHLRAYARFFATRRSMEGGRPRLLSDDELDDEERGRRQELEGELLGLRAAAAQAAAGRLAPATPATPLAPAEGEGNRLGSFWRFGENEDITIVCAELPEEMRKQMPLADRSSPDYVKLYIYADLDALVELHGHLRAVNPLNQVNIRLARELREDDYTSHLVLLGGVDWNQATEDVLALLDLPVTLKPSENRACFKVRQDDGRIQTFEPIVEKPPDRMILRSDVGHFYRGLNPFNVERSVTICQALFGRGTYGVVRALTDARFRRRNEEYVRSRFAGSDAFSILTRVPIQRGLTVTPDWTRSDVRLHEWQQAAE